MIRTINQEGVSLIKYFEGFSPAVYLDAAGLATIGYGHLLRKNEVYEGEITQRQAEILLQQDLGVAQRAVQRLVHVPLTDNQFAALVSFAFNLGAGALQRSTLRHKVNREEHGEVPAEFKRWVWAGGKRLAGLIRRREAEAVLYQS
ncbi:MAG: lysozyme [Rickettsiales bacterium]